MTNEQRRQTVDARQVHEAYWNASELLRRRFDGSMRWVTRAQARAAHSLAHSHLGLELDDQVLRGLPESVRALAGDLAD